MVRRISFKGALALAIPAVAALVLAIGASADPQTVTFAASHDGASAGWSNGKGSAIDLTLGSSATTYAEVVLHHANGVVVSGLDEPTFVTNNYNAGSPRYYITLKNGDSLWGYPSNAGLNGSDFAWAINNGNTYESWTAVQASEGSTTVTGAYVIADGDQAPGTMDQITGLTFGGVAYN
jgi:hypothetical protein